MVGAGGMPPPMRGCCPLRKHRGVMMGYRSDSFDLHGGTLAEEEADNGNYLGRHWRGHLSLERTYWVNGVMTNIIVMVLGLLLMALERSGQSLRLISFGFIIYFALFLIIRGWAMVGIWRSAGQHSARGGSSGWAVVARVMVAIGVLSTVAQAPNLALQAREYGLIAVGRDPIGPIASMVLDPTGSVLEINGLLSAGVADAFAEKIGAAPKLGMLSVDSDGGRIAEALRMAELIKARGLDVRVEQRCASACTFLLLAGKERSAHQFAEIGFHQPDFPGFSQDDRTAAIADNRADYIKAGITPAFLDRALSTLPQDMWFPNHDELVDAGVLTAREITVGSSVSDQRRLMEILARNAAETNQASGQMVDKITRLISAKASGVELSLKYQLTEGFDRSRRAALGERMRTSVRGAVCADIQGQLIAQGARYTFDYVGPDGEDLFGFTIDKCPERAG